MVEAAGSLGLDIDPTEFPDGTRTAADAAAAIGVELGQIVKSLCFEVDGATVLALMSGSNQLDEAALARAAGAVGATARRVDAQHVRDATGFPIGGVPPIGLATDLPVYIDEDLLGYDVVWAAAGTPHMNFCVAPAELVRATGGTVVALRRAG